MRAIEGTVGRAQIVNKEGPRRTRKTDETACIQCALCTATWTLRTSLGRGVEEGA